MHRQNRPQAGRRAGALCTAFALLLGSVPLAYGGTCGDPGSELNEQEARNVRTACEQMRAAISGWQDPEGGKRRLMAVQADDFFFTGYGSVRGKRDDYIKLVTQTQQATFLPVSDMNVYATTAQGDRVAIEMVSDIVEKGGTPYTNRYHQLFLFNDAGKIREYRLYHDTGIQMRDSAVDAQKVASDFLWSLRSGGSRFTSYLLTDDATWDIEKANGSGVHLDKAALLKWVAHLQNSIDGFIIEPVEGATFQANRISVEAESRGVFDGTRKPYRNVHSFVLTLQAGKIKSIREYSDTRAYAALLATAEPDDWVGTR